MSAAGEGAAAFLHAPKILQGCSMSNTEFELAVKLRVGAPILNNSPTTCDCGEIMYQFGDHLLKCKRNNEWD